MQMWVSYLQMEGVVDVLSEIVSHPFKFISRSLLSGREQPLLWFYLARKKMNSVREYINILLGPYC